MQEQILECIGEETKSFCLTFKRAQHGDNQALLEILDFLHPDMEYLATFIKLPREESINEMKTAMIGAIRSGEIQHDFEGF